MSAMLEALRKVRINGQPQRIPIKQRMGAVVVEPQPSPSTELPYATAYVIEATVSQTVYSRHHMADEPLTEQVQRALAHAVFSDIQGHLHDLIPIILDARANGLFAVSDSLEQWLNEAKKLTEL